MSAFAAIAMAEARAELAVAQAIGVKFGLVHRGAAEVILYGTILLLDIGQWDAQRKRRVETGEIEIVIATGQAGFAYANDNSRPVTPGDRIQYPNGSGRYFYVEPGKDSVEQYASGYVYKVKALEKKSITIGDKS